MSYSEPISYDISPSVEDAARQVTTAAVIVRDIFLSGGGAEGAFVDLLIKIPGPLNPAAY